MENLGTSTTGGRTWGPQLFFSSSGRMGRAPFLVAVAVLAGAFALYEETARGALHGWTAWAVHLALLFCAACVLSKRLHDRGRAGWWAAFPLWAFAVAWPQPHGLLGVIAALILAWAVVDLGLLPGEAGFNRYGPRPR